MRFSRSFEEESGREVDPLQPLRSLNAPLGVDRIQSLVFERMGAVSFWTTLRGLLFEVLALGTVAFLVSNISTPSAGPARVTTAATQFAVASASAPAIASSSASAPSPIATETVVVQRATGTRTLTPSRHLTSHREPVVLPTLGETQEAATPTLHSVGSRITNSVIRTDVGGSLESAVIRSSSTFSQDDGSYTSLFARLDGGVLFQDFSMTSAGAEIGITDGWKTVALEARTANGRRDAHDALLHRASGLLARVAQNEQQFGLQAGIEQHFGNVSARATVGPGYWISNMAWIDPTSGSQSTTNLQRFGVSAEASMSYFILPELAAGVTGIANYHGPFDGGVMLSIIFSP